MENFTRLRGMVYGITFILMGVTVLYQGQPFPLSLLFGAILATGFVICGIANIYIGYTNGGWKFIFFLPFFVYVSGLLLNPSVEQSALSLEVHILTATLMLLDATLDKFKSGKIRVRGIRWIIQK